MMPHAHVVKAEVAQNIFRRLDHPQFFRRHRFAVRNARTQAGHLRLVRRRQAELRGQFADFRLRQSNFLQRRAHLKFARRLRARTKIARVARVLAVGNHRKIFGLGDGREFLEQFVFAKIAAVGRVRRVFGIFKFRRLHHADGKLELLRDGQRLLQFAARQAGRIGNDSQSLFAQNIVRHARQKNRVHAAGIGDETRAVAADLFPQPVPV